MTPSDTNKTDNTEIDELDEILDWLPNAWCDDCKHPRCIAKKQSAKAALETLITQRCIDARIDELKKVGCCDYWEDGCSLNVCNGDQLDRIAALNKEGE